MKHSFAKIIATAATALSALTLSACVGGAPAPATAPDSVNGAEPVLDASSQAGEGSSQGNIGVAKAAEHGSAATAAGKPLSDQRLSTRDGSPSADHASQASIQKSSATSDASSVASADASSEASKASADAFNNALKNAFNAPGQIDPYTAFPTLAEGVFAHAEALYKAGLADSAVAYLQRFRIIKPLWMQWESKADSMIFEFDKTRMARLKQYEPLVFEIQNMNRAKSSYSMVVQTADSLIAMAPGDSLSSWAEGQKQVAYKNTLAKAQKEYAEIKALAEDKAQFAEADKRAHAFQMRYRDFEDVLHIQALVDHIQDLMHATDPAAMKFWESHDPAKALAEADAAIKAGKYSEAKATLNKLKASKLRKEATAKTQELADAYCNAKRKETSVIFAKAQKQTEPAKKRELLQQAIEPLDKCLSEYPNNSQKKKIIDNKQFLEKEIAK